MSNGRRTLLLLSSSAFSGFGGFGLAGGLVCLRHLAYLKTRDEQFS